MDVTKIRVETHELLMSFFLISRYALYSKTSLGYYYHLHQLDKYKTTHDQPHSVVTPWCSSGTCQGSTIGCMSKGVGWGNFVLA